MQRRRRSSSKISIASAGRHNARAELETMAWLPSLYKVVRITTPSARGAANTSTSAALDEEQENKNGQLDLFSDGLGVCDQAAALPPPFAPRLSDVYRSLPNADAGAQPSTYDVHPSPLLRIRAAAAACREELA